MYPSVSITQVPGGYIIEYTYYEEIEEGIGEFTELAVFTDIKSVLERVEENFTPNDSTPRLLLEEH